MDYATLIVPIISVGISAIAFITAQQRASKDDVNATRDKAEARLEKMKEDAVKLEHRLTIAEQNQFSFEDKKCLHDIAAKMDVLWTAAKEDFPGLLKHLNTPRYDSLLNKANRDIQSLSDKEAEELLTLLRKEVETAKRTETKENIERAAIASLYSAILKYERKKDKIHNVCK